MHRNLLGLIVLIISTSAIYAQEVNSKRGIALEGYDPVSYFKDGPKKGDKATAYTYKEVTYYFSTADNLEVFKTDPEAYLPQYGGFCAYAVAKSGDKVGVNPKTFEIRDNKLYLFYNSWGNNTLKKWLKDPENLQKQADANWNN